MAKYSVMLVVLCTMLVLQLVSSYPAENGKVELQKDIGAPLGLSNIGHSGQENSSEDKDNSKSDNASSEEKKGEAAAPE